MLCLNKKNLSIWKLAAQKKQTKMLCFFRWIFKTKVFTLHRPTPLIKRLPPDRWGVFGGKVLRCFPLQPAETNRNSMRGKVILGKLWLIYSNMTFADGKPAVFLYKSSGTWKVWPSHPSLCFLCYSVPWTLGMLWWMWTSVSTQLENKSYGITYGCLVLTPDHFRSMEIFQRFILKDVYLKCRTKQWPHVFLKRSSCQGSSNKNRSPTLDV